MWLGADFRLVFGVAVWASILLEEIPKQDIVPLKEHHPRFAENSELAARSSLFLVLCGP